MTTQLLQPVQSGIKNIHFFEGRLLTGRDMREQQKADREQRRQLGRAMGAGIVKGLSLTIERDGADGQAPVVSVSQGLAVTAGGSVLEIADPYLHIKLSRELKTPQSENDLFSDCSGPPRPVVLPNGTGLYLLCASPASSYEDYAPMSGLTDGGVASTCGRRYRNEGVQFRLVEIDPLAMPALSPEVETKLKNDLLSVVNPAGVNDPARLSLLRNILAHLCFGTERILRASADPFQTLNSQDTGPDASLALQGPGCDEAVPLALIYWTLDGIAFLDHWSVRRELNFGPSAAALSGNMPEALFDVMYKQFNEHMRALLKSMVETPSFSEKPLNDFFYYIPSLGAVPIVGGGSARGFSLGKFFAGRASGSPTVIGNQEAFDLYAAARHFHPIAVSGNDILQLYWIKENLEAVQAGNASQHYVIFTSRDLHSFRENDSVTLILGQTWKSYSGLLQKLVLLPKSMTIQAMPVWTALYSIQQNIIQYAMSHAATAGSRGLNRVAVMQTFSDLYQLQKDMTHSLGMTFDGDDGLADRVQFADRLIDLLDGALPSGGPAMKTALEADEFQNVLQAQEAINSLTSNWSGEVIAGRVQIDHVGSPDGEDLVPGRAEAFVFEVLVTARTEKRARIVLSAYMDGFTTGSWGNAVRLLDATNATPIGSVELNPDQSKSINVEVTVPNDAEVNQNVILKVAAELPAPTNRQFIKEITLQTAADAGAPVKWRLELQALALAGGRDDAAPSGNYTFILSSAYSAAGPPLSTSCTLTATFAFQNSSRSDWGLQILGQPDAETGPETGVLQYTFTLPTVGGGGAARTRIGVRSPAGRKAADQGCTFKVAITADIIDPETGAVVHISHERSEGFSVVLQGTA